MAEYSNIDYLLAQHSGEVLHTGKDGTLYNGGTWSPWLGCSHAGAGCAHCWAEEWASRFPRFRGHWGSNAPRHFFGDQHWKAPLRWNRKCERLGVRKRVLVSLCDPFETGCEAPGTAQDMAAARARLFALIAATPMLDWLLLTKRPENLELIDIHTRAANGRTWDEPCAIEPIPNLWLGVSIWDQPSADRGIPLLLEVPAALHWVSYEPALGPVTMHIEWLAPFKDTDPMLRKTPRIGWLVAGCESDGPWSGRYCGWRRMESLAEQCKSAGVPMFTKQLPEYGTDGGRLIKSAQLKREGWPVEMPR